MKPEVTDRNNSKLVLGFDDKKIKKINKQKK
jgi:hypothetical protein